MREISVSLEQQKSFSVNMEVKRPFTIEFGTAINLNDANSHTHANKTTLDAITSAVKSSYDTHLINTNNPHNTTSTQILPSQAGKSGQYLKTNGASVSWDQLTTSDLVNDSSFTTLALVKADSQVADAITKKHSHTNQTILDNTSASFTTALKTSYDGAVTNEHTHSNKSALDLVSGTNTGDQDLSGKQDVLVSGTNIKTVNNNSLLGSGNVDINAGVWGQITGTLTSQTDLTSVLNSKLNIIDAPTNTSDLINDSGFITEATISGATPIRNFPVVTNDIVNTTNPISLWNITIPANSFEDGDSIKLKLFIERKNNTGLSRTITHRLDVGSHTGADQTTTESNNANPKYTAFLFEFSRVGNSIYVNSGNSTAFGVSTTSYQNITGDAFTQEYIAYSYTPDFTQDILISNVITLPTASADLYYKILSAHALKYYKNGVQGSDNTHNHTATQITTDTTNFSGNLSSLDNTVQKALDTLDNISLGAETDPVFTSSPAYNLTTIDIGNIHTHSNKTLLDAIDLTTTTNWNTAYSNTHTHSNKSTLDSIQEALTTALKSNYDTAYSHSQTTHAPSDAVSLTTVKADSDISSAISLKHSHSNKSLLDAIDLTTTTNWNTAYTHSGLTSGNPHNVTKTDVGLGNVDNTSDANKPISSLTQTALNGKENFHGVVARPVGASNPIPTTITSTTFTLGTLANPMQYYYQGTLVTVNTNKSATLDDGAGGTTAGLYFVYFNAATGNILATKTFPGLTYQSNVLIATVTWNGSNLGLVNDERHGYERNLPWHLWAHDTIGTRWESGITLTHNSGTGAAATFATTSGNIHDEDIEFVVDASSAFPTANTGRYWYQTGANTYAFVATAGTTPGYLGANSRPNYVNSTGYALTQMTSATNRYINVFVYATTDLHTPIYFVTETVTSTIAGTNGHTTLANARAIPFPDLKNKNLPPEMKAIYRLIWRADGALQAIDVNQDDYRNVTSLPQAAGNASTTAAAVSFSAGGNISSTTVQTAIDELDLEKLSLDQTVSQTIANGQPIFDTLTASQLVATDANKKLQSLAVATYPSLTELSYVKGVTSAIQTQIGTKISSSSTDTLTNKRYQKRVYNTTSTNSLTPEISTYDIFELTALAAGLTINNHSTSTPVAGEQMLFRIKDNGNAQTIAYGDKYRASSDLAKPTTTVAGKTLYMGFIWNAADSKWDLLAVLNNI